MLDRLSLNRPEGAGQPLLLNVADVAALLNVSTRSVWRMCRLGQCPEPVRVGGSTRWRTCDLQEWVAAGCPAVNGRGGGSTDD